MANENINLLRLKVLTPQKKLIDIDCAEVHFPSCQGQLGIYPGHADLVCLLGTGLVHYSREGVFHLFVVSKGIAKISEGKVITLMADLAEEALTIDPERAQRALDRARRRLAGGPTGEETDIERAFLAESKAIARVQAFSLVKSSKGIG